MTEGMNEIRIRGWQVLCVIGVLLLETWWIVKSVADSVGY